MIMMQSAATAISALIGVFSWVARGGPVIGLGGSQYDDHRRSTSTQTQGHAQHLRHSGSIGSGVAGSGLERSGHEKLGGRSRLRGGGGGGGDGWNGVSDGSDGKVFCNSIGCPVDHVPIEDAQYVECEGVECTKDQCCRALCSSFPCQDGYNVIPKADIVECEKQGCSTGQCCEREYMDSDGSKEEDKPRNRRIMCSDFACPSGSIPVFDSETLRCDDDMCNQQQCCLQIEKVPAASASKRASKRPRKRTSAPTCAEYTCPIGYAPHSDSNTTKCFEGVCDTDQCCMKWTSDHSNPAIEPPASTSSAPVIAMCFDYICSDGYMPHSDYDTTECFEGGCDVEQCCMESVETPAAETGLMCSEFTCPEGYAPHAEYYTTECFDGACDVQQCCVSDDSNSAFGAVVYSTPVSPPSLHHKHQYHHDSCSTYQCPPRHVHVDNANSLGCGEIEVGQSRGSHDPSVHMKDESFVESTASNGTSAHTGGDAGGSDADTIDLYEEEIKTRGGVSVEAIMLWENQKTQSKRSASSSGGIGGDKLGCNSSTCCQKIDREEGRQLNPWAL